MMRIPFSNLFRNVVTLLKVPTLIVPLKAIIIILQPIYLRRECARSAKKYLF